MRYFIDAEFYEDGERIHPISFAMVRQDHKELYIEFKNIESIEVSQWIKDNVVPHLDGADLLSTDEAKEKILEFVGNDSDPIFWAYYADYDWVLFCQLFGTMIELPNHFPKFCMDLQQWWVHLGKPELHRVRPPQPENQHNALADARWNMEYWNRLKSWNQTPM